MDDLTDGYTFSQVLEGNKWGILGYLIQWIVCSVLMVIFSGTKVATPMATFMYIVACGVGFTCLLSILDYHLFTPLIVVLLFLFPVLLLITWGIAKGANLEVDAEGVKKD